MQNPTVTTDSPQVWCYEGYSLDPSHFVTAMVHYYRAEVTRANVWRTRLDTTTNWAVVTTGAALTFAYGDANNPHFVLLLVQLLVLTFLLIEARRYSYYGLWYHRVRLIETDFFAAMISPPYQPAEGWGDALSHTMREPAFVTPRWRAAAVRYRRNYVWLFTLVVIAWLVPEQPIDWSPGFLGALLFAAVPGTAMGWMMWLYVLNRLPAGTAAPSAASRSISSA